MADLELEPDYPLADDFAYFLDYMFVSEPKYARRHRTFARMHVMTTSGMQPDTVVQPSITDMDDRRRLRDDFEETLASHGIDVRTDGAHVGCAMFYIDDDDDLLSQDAFSIIGEIVTWAEKNDRACAVVAHLDQDISPRQGTGREMPHVHVLYERVRENELQDWLVAMG